MSKQQISTLTPSNGVGYLMPSAKSNSIDDEKILEKLLRDKIAGIRKNDGGNLQTNWDS